MYIIGEKLRYCKSGVNCRTEKYDQRQFGVVQEMGKISIESINRRLVKTVALNVIVKGHPHQKKF